MLRPGESSDLLKVTAFAGTRLEESPWLSTGQDVSRFLSGDCGSATGRALVLQGEISARGRHEGARSRTPRNGQVSAPLDLQMQ